MNQSVPTRIYQHTWHARMHHKCHSKSLYAQPTCTNQTFARLSSGTLLTPRLWLVRRHDLWVLAGSKPLTSDHHYGHPCFFFSHDSPQSRHHLSCQSWWTLSICGPGPYPSTCHQLFSHDASFSGSKFPHLSCHSCLNLMNPHSPHHHRCNSGSLHRQRTPSQTSRQIPLCSLLLAWVAFSVAPWPWTQLVSPQLLFVFLLFIVLRGGLYHYFLRLPNVYHLI